jgi:hypothetical protein
MLLLNSYFPNYDNPIATKLTSIVTDPLLPDGNFIIPSALSLVTEVKTTVAAFPPDTVLVTLVIPARATGTEVKLG